MGPRPKSDSGAGKNYECDTEFHRKYIFGGHVADYMNKLKDDDEEAYKKQFGRYMGEGIEPDGLEGLYEAAHKEIRENPNKPRGDLERGRFCTRQKAKDKDHVYEHKKFACHPVKLTCSERKEREKTKLKEMGLRAVPRTSSYNRKKLIPPKVKDNTVSKKQKRQLAKEKAARKEKAKTAREKMDPAEKKKRKMAKKIKYNELKQKKLQDSKKKSTKKPKKTKTEE